jgi:hypothetical protein
MLEDFDPDDFWDDSDYARESYVEAPLTTELLASVERDLGFTLPASYVALMRTQNGGIPTRTCAPTETATSWAEDHVALSGFLGIGRTRRYSLLGPIGSRYMQTDWGYPTFGVCICNCPSAGHDMIMLDYRACGPDGEPTVVHVDQEQDYRVTPLAPDFETFVRGLVDDSVYDTSAAELDETLGAIDTGRFSTPLTQLLAASPSPTDTERTLRRLLRAIATEKGFLALHADPLSHLVYDVLFSLFAAAHPVATPCVFLDAYRDLLAFGDGDISTGGYAPGFVADWMNARLASAAFVERAGTLAVSDAHCAAVDAQLAALH